MNIAKTLLNIGVIAFILFVIGDLIFLSYNFYKRRKKQQQLKVEK